MKFLDIKLPSNKKFGIFFTFIFAVATVFSYKFSNMIFTYTFAATFFMFLCVTIIKAEILLPLNQLWMRFGFLLGTIVSPIVLGIIFFALITPYGLVMRMFGRDELLLKPKKNNTYWKSRSQVMPQTDFKKQF